MTTLRDLLIEKYNNDPDDSSIIIKKIGNLTNIMLDVEKIQNKEIFIDFLKPLMLDKSNTISFNTTILSLFNNNKLIIKGIIETSVEIPEDILKAIGYLL